MPTRLKLPGLQKEICQYWYSNQHSLFPHATDNKRSSTWVAERNTPILGLEPTQFFSKVTANTHSTTWAAERNIQILGLEPTQFISEG